MKIYTVLKRDCSRDDVVSFPSYEKAFEYAEYVLKEWNVDELSLKDFMRYQTFIDRRVDMDGNEIYLHELNIYKNELVIEE